MELSRPYLASDLDEAANTERQQQNAAQVVLDQLGNMLHQADEALDNLEKDDMLGSAIVRGCRDLADACAGLADQIDHQSNEDRRALAQACILDAQEHSLYLHDEKQTSSGHIESTNSSDLDGITSLSEEEVMNAIQVAASVLRDVEDTLRAIEQNEADEIADAALTVSRLFVESVKSIHEGLTPQDLIAPTSRGRSLDSSIQIEMLGSDDSGDAPSPQTKEEADKKNRMKRLRCLWPPLGPAVVSALDWGKEEGSKRPLFAVALGLALWPLAVVTTLVGAPVVIADGVVQGVYNNFQDGPIIHGLERTAAQVYQGGRLSLVCGKVLGRQALRVASRQVKRHGGVGKIAQEVGGFALDRITHPVETVGMAWNGLAQGVVAIQGAVEQLSDHERATVAQDLQQ